MRKSLAILFLLGITTAARTVRTAPKTLTQVRSFLREVGEGDSEGEVIQIDPENIEEINSDITEDFQEKLDEAGDDIHLEYPYTSEFKGSHTQHSEDEYEGEIEYSIDGTLSGQVSYGSDEAI